ncbi:hypothetical protein EON64_12475 [archaeon]|nr:MAG: hypothetical protein EON64_12475 [archaeon]
MARADSAVYGVRDPLLSRRGILERYMDYCDRVQGDEGPVRVLEVTHQHSPHRYAATSPLISSHSLLVADECCLACFSILCSEGREHRVSCSVLLNAMRSVITGLKHTNKYRQALNDIYVEEVRRLGGKQRDAGDQVRVRTVVEEALKVLDADQLDVPLGDSDFHPLEV